MCESKMQKDLTAQYTGEEQKDYISQSAQRHRDLKNNQIFPLCVLCGLCERNNSFNMIGLSSLKPDLTTGY